MKLKFPHLGSRWLAALGAREGVPGAHSDRLREVLGRDRALAVGARAQARASALGPRAQTCALTMVAAPAEPPAAPVPEPCAPIAPSLPPPAAAAVPEACTQAAPVEPSAAALVSERSAPVTPSLPPPAPAAVAGASAASDERPQRVQHEPIRTRTMARLLAAQGYLQRSLAIYDELLAQAGADETLRADAEALRARLA